MPEIFTRRDFLRAAGAGTAAVGLFGLQGCGSPSGNRFAASGRERPNFLFLFTDDQAFRTVHALNNPDVQTPNLDRLVQRGLTFTHTFNQGSWSPAVCIASRAMLNTGRYVWTCGGNDCDDYPLWGQILGEDGYDTFMTGKWHNGERALKRSFKHIGPHGPGMFPSRDPNAEENRKHGIIKDPYNRPRPGNSWSPSDSTLLGHWRHVNGKIVHSAQLWADAAIDYLRSRAGKQHEPFFAYVAFHSPHDPRQSPQEFLDLYPPEKIRIPPNFLPEHPFDQGDARIRDELLAPFPRTEEAIRVHLQEYYALITFTDYQIGRILKALEETGEADNTVIIFSSDQGLAVGEHGLMGKQNQYDCAVRMPYVWVGPGIPQGRKIGALVYLQSAFATTCEMAGVPVPDTVQFPSLVPLITGEKQKLYDSIYGAYRNFQRMVRTEKYKLIRYPQVGEVQLFDLENDPWEINNLARQPRYRDVVRRLDSDLAWWMRETEDPLTGELKLSIEWSKSVEAETEW